MTASDLDQFAENARRRPRRGGEPEGAQDVIHDLPDALALSAHYFAEWKRATAVMAALVHGKLSDPPLTVATAIQNIEPSAAYSFAVRLDDAQYRVTILREE
jgi:hypothetical protein